MSNDFRFDENDNGGHIKNTNVVFIPQLQVVDAYIRRIDPVARGYSQNKPKPMDESLALESVSCSPTVVDPVITTSSNPMPNAIQPEDFARDSVAITESIKNMRIAEALPMPPYQYQKEDYSGSITGSTVYMNPMPKVDLSMDTMKKQINIIPENQNLEYDPNWDKVEVITLPHLPRNKVTIDDANSTFVVGNTAISWYENGPKYTLDLNSKTTLTIDPSNCDVVFTGTKYKYNELNLLNEMVKYVDQTYSEHYSSGRSKTQALDAIIDSGHGFSFCIGNVMKYAQRVEKKGSREDGRKDLKKIIHYALLALNEYDQETQEINEAN